MAEFAAITLIILILPSAFLFVLENYLGSDRQTVAVTTQSMEPIYHGYVERKGSPDFIDILNGDLLLIHEKTPENIQVGDVIIFDHPYEDIRVVHRVIDIKIDGNGKYYFKTKGDNPTTFNIYPDPWGWISADSIYGVVVFRIPFFGWLVFEVQKEFSRWIIILLAITLLIISFRESNEGIEEIPEKNNEKESKKVKIDNILTIIRSKIILFVRSRKIMVIGLIVGIVCLSFLSNLRGSFTPCRIILLDMKETDIIDPDDQWDGSNNVTRSFIILILKVESHGFFNHISSFEIEANNTLAYRWTIVYSFQGDKTIAAGLVLNKIIGTHIFIIKLVPYCSGLFAKGKTNHYILNIRM